MFQLLIDNNIDYLGVSLDSMLIFCTPEIISQIKELFTNNGIRILQIGEVIDEKKVLFESKDGKPVRTI